MGLVTIIADASFAVRGPSFGASGWAAFVASEGVKRYYGDMMHVRPYASTQAEMFACVNGLHMAIRDGLAYHGDKVIIQSDCINALEGLKKPFPADKLTDSKKAKGRTQMNEAYIAFRKMVARYALTVEFRHVRGHTGIGDSRSIVQDKCDRKAKYYMARQAAQFREAHENGKREDNQDNRERADACSSGG
jgi:ribonuclease HI